MAAMTRARRSPSRSTAPLAAASPRRAASKMRRAESRGDMPSSTASWIAPCAEATSSKDPHLLP